jgi:DNA-binding NarL/FixJ family response regulator
MAVPPQIGTLMEEGRNVETAANQSAHAPDSALPGEIQPSNGAGVRSSLTARETEVLRLLADGLTTKAVASRLGVSFKTAACHRSRILQKLGVESTVSAVRWAIRQGIVEL